MRTDSAIDRVKGELHSSLDTLRRDLDRIEILAAALAVFSRPVPDYEPTFRHLHEPGLNAHELG
jgi:hypothetical protein